MKYLKYGATVVAVIIVMGYAALQIPSVDVWLFRQVAFIGAKQGDIQLAAPDELSVLLCGTGSPLPDKTRAGPCTLIAAGDRLFVVDTGLDAVRNLRLWHVPMQAIDGVLITHFHSDHIAELGELRLQSWVSGRKKPLTVYGPPGIEQVVNGFNEAYTLDAGYRVAHHGADILPPDAVPLVPVTVEMTEAGTSPIMSEKGLTITAIRVHHDPATPAYGYRFDFAGRSVVVSGDTTKSENLVRAAKGADVLVHEALSTEMVGLMNEAFTAAGRPRLAHIMHDIPGYHTSPVEAASVANEAEVKLLLFTHEVPVLPNFVAEKAFMKGVSAIRPSGVILGHDGDLVRLPGQSDSVNTSRLN